MNKKKKIELREIFHRNAWWIAFTSWESSQSGFRSKKKWRPNVELASRRFLSGHPREKHFLIASRAALNRKCIKKNSSARIEIPPVEIHCGWDHTCLRTKKRDLDSKRKKKKKNKVKEEKKSNDTLVRYFVFYSDDVVIYIDSNSERCVGIVNLVVRMESFVSRFVS